MGKFAVKQTKSGGYRFNLVASNGEIIGVSETYTTKSACLKGVDSIRRNAPIAAVEDQTAGESAKNPKFEIYLDKAGEYRFRLKATNGEIILASEGYKRKESCKNGIESVRKNSTSDVSEASDK